MPTPQLAAVIQMLRDRPIVPEGATIQDLRKGMESSLAFPLSADIRVEPVEAGGVRAEWVAAPNASPARVVLYLHGGGYVIGSITTHRELCARIARAAAARVLVIDYRLAPEHPFPAAVEDAVAAYRWLIAQVPPEAVAIGGDSAGGGLTLATLLALRDRGMSLPAAGILLSPWTDLALTGESLTSRASLDPMIAGAEGIRGMAQSYMGQADPRNPLVSPLYGDLTSLPPLLIQVGTSEVLFDDSTRLDAKARAAGVDVTLEAWNDMIHVFQVFASMLAEGEQAIEKIGAFVQAHTREAVAS
jgi:epsilon-lactone hydrolase